MKEDTADDGEFQASSEDIDIKPWDLPYWRGAPKEDKTDVVEDVIEEEVEVVEPITVEELEKIRREGYEEGFLQGLNEGREKGEKEGYEQGLVIGKEEGHKEGKQEGNRIGFEAGQAEGLALGKEEISQAASHLAQLGQQLEQSLVEKDAALPQVLSQLIQTACKTILERELEQGDNQISQKVTFALEQLPSGAKNVQIFVSTRDALHLEHGLSNSGREMHFNIDDSLTIGSARITTEHSLIEFSHSERMKKIFEFVEQQCEKLDLSDLAGEVTEDINMPEDVVEEVVENNELDFAPSDEDPNFDEDSNPNENEPL